MIEFFLAGFELGIWLLWFLLGVTVGVALDYLWWKTGVGKYEKRLEMFEHYHWGLILLILMRTLISFNAIFLSFSGMGTSFILAEITQQHPFALKSNHQLSSTIIGAILSVFTVFTWV